MEKERVTPDQVVRQCLSDIFPLEAFDERCVGVRVQALEETLFLCFSELDAYDKSLLQGGSVSNLGCGTHEVCFV